MHFKAMPTHKPRTLKQNSTITITKKAKGRALSLERRRQRLNPSQTKLANNKELFCEPCTYGKQHAIPTTSPTPGLDTDQPIFRPTTRSMTRKSTSQEAVGASKSTNTVDLAIVMPEHDTEVEYEDWTTEVIPSARAFYATSTTGLNNDQPSYDRAMKDSKVIWLRNLLAEIDLFGAPATFLPQNEPNLPPISMAMDNQGAIVSATLGSQNRRTRHINIRYPYIRDCVESGTIAPHYTSTSDVD
jgi:hypothetical protein